MILREIIKEIDLAARKPNCESIKIWIDALFEFV